MLELTPARIAAELDRYIVGQAAAKRAVAVALRSRWRWMQLPDDVRRDIMPRNILMVGPTGVGKTEITRRLADLIGAPFVKVEATKYTEVGYYGRDVETIIRDLVETALSIVRARHRRIVEEEAQRRVEERIINLLRRAERSACDESGLLDDRPLLDQLRAGELESRHVELEASPRTAPVQVMSAIGSSSLDLELQRMLEQFNQPRSRTRRLTVAAARSVLLDEEIDALTDRESLQEEALRLAENSGVVFLDEIDKVCAPEGGTHGPDVSRQGVQRDLLPIVEGTTVQTRYGSLKTDYILFIAAGAFHTSRPSDLMPELQGRFPIRVELSDLTRDDFVRILTEPRTSLVSQYQTLMRVEGIDLQFQSDSIEALADIAWQVNQSTQNIGARRLHTIMERLLEDISFEAPDRSGETITIDAAFVRSRLESIAGHEDLSRFIL